MSIFNPNIYLETFTFIDNFDYILIKMRSDQIIRSYFRSFVYNGIKKYVKIFWLIFHEKYALIGSILVSQKFELLCHVQYGYYMEIEIFIPSLCVILQDIYGLI